MTAIVEPSSGNPRPGSGQSRLEQAIERGVILFAQAMMVLGLGAVVYGFLVMMFFFCCGVETLTYFSPTKSPLGPVVTILLVWPMVGLLCSMLEGGPRELFELVRSGVRRFIKMIRPVDKI